MTKADRLAARLSRLGAHLFSVRRKIATGAAAALAATVGFHVVLGQNGILAFQAKRRDATDLALQVQQMQRENEKLRGHVDRLSRDPDAIEHEAREELHYARPGEVIFTLPVAPSAKAR